MILEWKSQLLAPIGRERYHSVCREQVFKFLLVLVDDGTILIGQDFAAYYAYETPLVIHSGSSAQAIWKLTV
jgi:hypothetical protein